MDNQTVVSYVNRKGGTHLKVLSDLACQIWKWCISRNLTLHAQYLPGKLNMRADHESRIFNDSSDWMLNRQVFNRLQQRWGPISIDLFAARHNAQVERYYSFRPDPTSMAVDAFAQKWKSAGQLYAFPPIVIIGRCLQKIKEERVETVVMVTSAWGSQAWYPVLLEMAVEEPVILLQVKVLLSNAQGKLHPLLEQRKLHIVAWRVSRVDCTKEFRRRLPRSSAVRGEQEPRKTTVQPGVNGIAGVVEDKLILFRAL